MIRFAVLGPGRISHRFMEGIKEVDHAEVVAFATRNKDKVKEYADQYHVSSILSYEELYASKEIDAVYIATPQFVHLEQVLACLKSGKHCIVEKPIALTAEDARTMYACAKENQVALLEAQKELFIPAFQTISDLLTSNAIGTIRSAEASFSRYAPHPADSWVMSKPGKGCVYDVGVYPLTELITLFGMPEEVQRLDTNEEGCPVSSVISMRMKNQILTTAFSSFRTNRENYLIIYGDEGTIQCREFWKAKDVTCTTAKGTEVFHSDFGSEFAFEIRHLMEMIEQHRSFSPILTPEINEKVIEISEPINVL